MRYAERAAMLDHFTNNRYEWGTGRGAGSHELASFNILDPTTTKAEWEEVIKEVPRMWEQEDYSYEGEHFTVPTPHNVLPKPYGKGHPPIWVACGNPPTFAAPASSASVPSRSTSSPSSTSGAASTRTRKASQLHRAHRPVQERQRDDHQLGDLLRDA